MKEREATTIRTASIIVWETAVFAAVSITVCGFLNGTVAGDVPWPATPTEAGSYDAATVLGAVAVASASAALITAVVTRPVRWKAARIAWTVAGSLAALLGLFFAGYFVGSL